MVISYMTTSDSSRLKNISYATTNSKKDLKGMIKNSLLGFGMLAVSALGLNVYQKSTNSIALQNKPAQVFASHLKPASLESIMFNFEQKNPMDFFSNANIAIEPKTPQKSEYPLMASKIEHNNTCLGFTIKCNDMPEKAYFTVELSSEKGKNAELLFTGAKKEKSNIYTQLTLMESSFFRSEFSTNNQRHSYVLVQGFVSTLESVVNKFIITYHPDNGLAPRIIGEKSFQPDIDTLKAFGIEVLYGKGKTIREKNAQKVCREIVRINDCMPKDKKLMKVFLHSEIPSQNTPKVLYAAYVPSVKSIIGSDTFLDTKHADLVAFHEATHHFFCFGIKDKYLKKVIGHYLCAIESEKKMPYSPNIEENAAYAKSLFSLIDESTYLTALPKAGHPYSHEQEMFASAATILRFFGSEFLEKNKNLNHKNVSACAIARSVLDSFDGNPGVFLETVESLKKFNGTGRYDYVIESEDDVDFIFSRRSEKKVQEYLCEIQRCAAEINRLLPQDKKMLVVFVSDYYDKLGNDSALMGPDMPYYRADILDSEEFSGVHYFWIEFADYFLKYGKMKGVEHQSPNSQVFSNLREQNKLIVKKGIDYLFNEHNYHGQSVNVCLKMAYPELIASDQNIVLDSAILKYHPDQFLKELKKLDPEDKKVVSQYTRNLMSIFVEGIDREKTIGIFSQKLLQWYDSGE